MLKIVVLAGFAAALAFPVAAQTSNPSSGSTSGSQSSSQGQNSPSMQQKVKSDLEQAGFKNVQVMAQSFLVRANDKDGHPIMMVINPDSITTITQVQQSGSSSGSSASGSGTDTSKK